MKAYTHILASLLVLLILALLVCTPGCKKEEPKEPPTPVTIANLQAAYGLALKRALWYDRFAKQADKERAVNVAMLFRAVSRSEQIHADNYAKLLKGKGVEPQAPQIDSVAPGNTRQYVKMAHSNESMEVETLYPATIQAAETEKFDAAIEQFKRTQDGDKRHLGLLSEALERGDNFPKLKYFICPECGFITITEKALECQVCKTKKEKFERI